MPRPTHQTGMTERVRKALGAYRRVTDAQRSLDRATAMLNTHVEGFNEAEGKQYALATGAVPRDRREQIQSHRVGGKQL